MLIAAAIALLQPLQIGEPDPEEGWEGLIEATASAASGNTDNFLIGATVELDRMVGFRFSHSIEGGINYARTRDPQFEEARTTQNNLFAQYRLQVQLGDRSFTYGRVRYDRDTFSGFDHRVFVGAGLGYDILIGEERSWQIFGGPGVRYAELNPVGQEAGEGPRQTEFAFYTGSEFAFLLREGVALEQNTDLTVTGVNTTLIAKQSVRTDLTERISSRLSFDVNYESNPPEGRERTDTLLRGSIGYSF